MSNEPNKKPQTRESYRRRKDRERLENRLGNVLGWQDEQGKNHRSKNANDETQEDTMYSQTTRMFSLNDEAVQREQPKRRTAPQANARKALSKQTARTSHARSLPQVSKAKATPRVNTPKTNSQINDQSFWQIKRGKLDRYLTVGIVVLIIGIILLTIVALYF
ncbi:MAG: hypothetical protein MR008_03140 [Aerococcus sp.]|nr:hypothetical protein [Aerococcus sp.]